jgi:hypothetical protein
MSEQYVLSWHGIDFTNPNKLRIDNYGNRYMDFNDGKGNVLVWRRDDLVIDHATGACKPRDVDKKPLKVMVAPAAPQEPQAQQG